MKRLFIILLTLLPLIAFGQKTEGIITYLEKVNLHMSLSEEDEQIKAMLPEFRKSKKLLLFNQSASIYKNPETDPNAEPESFEHEEGNMQIQIKIDQPDEQLYKDLKSGNKIDQRDFLGKKFLIMDKLSSYAWKLTGKQKKVLDYNCQQAMFEDSANKTIVWFTTDIPVSTGPSNLGQLPGMILEVDINDGERTVVAQKVELKPVKKNAIEKPAKGKKVTQAEFEAAMEAQAKEMQLEMGGSGGGRTVKFIQRD